LILAPLAAEQQNRWAACQFEASTEYNPFMSIKEIETAALKLIPKDRARLEQKSGDGDRGSHPWKGRPNFPPCWV